MSPRADGVLLYPYDLATTMLMGTWGRTLGMVFLVPSKKFGLVAFFTDGGPAMPSDLIQSAMDSLLGVPPVPASTKKEGIAEFPKYVGTYSTPWGYTIDITTQGEGLHLSAGLDSCDLVPIYPPNFYCHGASWSWDVLSFVADATQHVKYLVVQDFVATRVEPSDAGAD
jgi:hypothetical protein